MNPLEEAKEWSGLTAQEKDLLIKLDYQLNKVAITRQMRYYTGLQDSLEKAYRASKELIRVRESDKRN